MSGFFDVEKMNNVLGTFCPEDESIIAAVYGVGKATDIIQYFSGCEESTNGIVPADKDNVIKVLKRKVCNYDLYIGYTEKSLIISECDMSTKYFYDIEHIVDPAFSGMNKLEKEITYKAIGKVLPLESIQKLEIKKGMFGSMNLVLKMNNGTFFKFMLAKRAGVGGQMPDHIENRDKIIEVLKKYSK